MFLKCDVGVPFVGDTPVGGGKLKYLWVCNRGIIQVGVAFQFAKMTAERHMFINRGRLIRQEQNEVLGQQ